MSDFKGIPNAAGQFFVELEPNNHREFWLTNKARFDSAARWLPFASGSIRVGDNFLLRALELFSSPP